MKKKNLIFGGLLLFAMSLSLTGCGKDDKEDEIVEDPLAKTIEYYIVGTVSNSTGQAIAGAKVEASSDINGTTNNEGVYSLTVTKAGTYTVKFSANGLENFETKVIIADNAANRTQTTLSVKMAKAIDMSKGATAEVSAEEEVVVEVPTVEEDQTTAPVAALNIPKGAAEAGTSVTAVTYVEAQAAPTTPQTGDKEVSASVANIAIVTTPADAKAKSDIEISVANAAASNTDFFDSAYMTALKESTTTTKAPTEFGKVIFKNNSYVVTIPTGETISGKYSTKVNYNKNIAASKAGEYNKVNDQSGVVKIKNEEYSASNVKLTVETMQGWKYTITPAAALEAIGASDKQATFINNAIIAEEGKEGTYTTTKELNASISGNHQLIFGSKAKVQEKTYTFYLIVNGEKRQAVVKLMCNVGYTEEYSNTPISQHSGGN